MVELRCEAQRGSPPILYRFYHEDVPLGNSSAPSGGGASFNLSLTAEHSGNYSCEADNGLGARRSEVVPLSLSGGLMVPGYRSIMTSGSAPSIFLGTILGFRKVGGGLGGGRLEKVVSVPGRLFFSTLTWKVHVTLR